jgi:hypothetical protein
LDLLGQPNTFLAPGGGAGGGGSGAAFDAAREVLAAQKEAVHAARAAVLTGMGFAEHEVAKALSVTDDVAEGAAFIREHQSGHPRARSHCRLAPPTHPLHTIFTNIFGASVSETTMRPNPRSPGPGRPLLARGDAPPDGRRRRGLADVGGEFRAAQCSLERFRTASRRYELP